MNRDKDTTKTMNPNDLIRMLDPVRLMGMEDFKLRLDQVLDKSFNEAVLSDLIKLRADGRAQTNAEAFDMIKGLDSKEVRQMVDSGLSRQQFDHQKSFKMNIDGQLTPHITFTSKGNEPNPFLNPSARVARPPRPTSTRPERELDEAQRSPDRKKTKGEKDQKRVRFKL